jgi:hypothetical protein
MYTLKGFITVDGLANSLPQSVAPIGEISSLSLTFAQGVGEYSGLPQPYTLRSFTSKTASGAQPVPSSLLTQIFAIVTWAFQLQQSQTPAVSSTAFNAAMTAQFGSTATSIGVGNMINNGSFPFPEFISFVNPTLVTNDPAAGGAVKLWFADASFQSQYDDYTITVVPPLPNLNTFMGGAIAVKAALSSYTQGQWLNAIQTAKGIYPETEVISQSYDYVNPLDVTDQTTTYWGIIIYGAAGNNVDAIRQAVQDYIAANSTYPEANWRVIFPEIYTSTEFLMFPRWNDYAIPNLILTQGGYSAIVSMNKQLTYLKTILPDVADGFIDAHTSLIPTNYKSVEVLVLPSTTNATPDLDILNIFPDLMNVPTTDTLFNLMAAKTRGWVSLILEMLIVAEQATVQSTLPAGMSTAIRDNILFVASEYAGITYLIATKGSTPAYS